MGIETDESFSRGVKVKKLKMLMAHCLETVIYYIIFILIQF